MFSDTGKAGSPGLQPHLSTLEQIPPKLETLAIRICSGILIWRESLSAKRFHFAGMRA
jgi:hypothetical protein